MTATSVLGLVNNGAGSADGKNKGSDHMSLGTNNLIGPRVVLAGTIALDGGGTTTDVTFGQALEEVVGNYVVILTPAALQTVIPYVSAFTVDGFTITHDDSSSDNIYYAVIHK